MATDISPSTGQGAVFLQAGPGTSPGYSAYDVRRALSGGLQEGVISAGGYKVTQRAAGANMTVDIAASTGLGAYVLGDSITNQGLYYVAPHSGVINETITGADPSNPRIDRIVLEVKDDTHDSSGLNKARVRVVDGTPTSGATLSNLSGAAAVPSTALLLADVLVGAGVTSITDANIRDRRSWARGAFRRVVRTANASSTANYETTSTTAVAVDSTNLAPRIECTGVPIRVTLSGLGFHSVAGESVQVQLRIDGSELDNRVDVPFPASVASQRRAIFTQWVAVPSAGSHTFSVYYYGSAAGTTRLYADSNAPLLFTVEELLRANEANG